MYSPLPRWNEQAPHLTALEALEHYQWTVIPLDQHKCPPKVGGVHPDGTPKRLSWKPYQSRRASKDLLLTWTQRYCPSAWAVITGALSGVLVLDFDGSAGKRQLDLLGLSAHVHTGSGGYHVYFKHPGWLVKTLNGTSKQELGQRWPGLDIRGDGGYAAFCGHNEQGPYFWLRDPILEDVNRLPHELRALLGLLHEQQFASLSTPHVEETEPYHQWDIRAQQLLNEALMRSGVEGRNNVGFWLACQLRDLPLAETDAHVIMNEYARCVPETNAKGKAEVYSKQEALVTLRSAYSRAPKERKEPHVPPRSDPTQARYLRLFPHVRLDDVLRYYSMGEWGDALLFAHLFKHVCVYDHHDKAWYIWQKHFWKRDDIGRIRQCVSGKLASAYLDASALLNLQLSEPTSLLEGIDMPGLEHGQENQEQIKKLVKGLATRAFALRSLSRNNNILAFASNDERLAVTSEIWDTDSWLFGTHEGVLDLSTGVLRAGKPQDYIRTIIPTVWRGLNEQAPRFTQFLQEIFADRNEDERSALISFLQRALGYGITGLVTEHIFLLLCGEEGRNGKDTLMSILQHVLGVTVGAVSNDVIISHGKMNAPGSAKPHLCSLQGKRIAWASETDKGDRFDLGQVKFLTGGGTIPARQLYGKEYAFAPSHLLVLLTNNRPHADAKDKAFWERICPITFHMRFVDHPVGPYERKKDGLVSSILKSEASGILAWLVHGCLEWQQRGLEIPASVLRERASYREEEDTFQQFLADCCVVAPGMHVKSSVLFERYKQWAEENVVKKMNGTAFGLEMKRTFQQRRNNQGSYYIGIGLSAVTQTPYTQTHAVPEEG